LTVTVIGPVVAPTGTVVVMLVVVLEIIVAVVPLNLTMLFAGATPKLVPVIVTEVPKIPTFGVNPVIIGGVINVNPASVAMPPGVVTDTFPDAPFAITAVILVADTTVNEVAAVPPKLTAVAPVKLVPVRVTVVRVDAFVGVNEAIVGMVGIKVNPAIVAVPPEEVTEILPEDPDPTTAMIIVGDRTVNDVAAVPPKLTTVAPVKFVPVMVTVAPAPALVGVNDAIVGGETKTGLFLISETILLLSFATAKSALPSPSRSPMATEIGLVLVKSTLAA
jgi:hypothetical protein